MRDQLPRDSAGSFQSFTADPVIDDAKGGLFVRARVLALWGRGACRERGKELVRTVGRHSHHPVFQGLAGTR